MMLFQICEHPVEVGSATRLGRFNVFELLHDHETVAGGIPAQKTKLGRNAEALLLLILTRYSHVQHSLVLVLRTLAS